MGTFKGKKSVGICEIRVGTLKGKKSVGICEICGTFKGKRICGTIMSERNEIRRNSF